MLKSPISNDELEQLISEYHHIQNEHHHTGPGGAGRRHMSTRMADIEQRFEQLLTHRGVSESERAGWRRRLRHCAPAPAASAPAAPVLVFKGRAESGSVVEIRALPEGGYAVALDRAPFSRLRRWDDVPSFQIDGRQFSEIFDTPPEALSALRAYCAHPSGPPPWQYASALTEDGLINRDFALSARGHRAMGAH